MSIEIKNEKNYAALVIRVPELIKAQNSDRLYIINVAGNTVVVNDSWKERVGQLAVMFPAESQISEGLAHHANLHRHADLNRIGTEQGYLEDNRRVRALKLRGNVSNGLILPILEVADYIGYSVPPADFEEGLIFDTVDGKELCRKYVIKATEPVNRGDKKGKQAFKRFDGKLFPEHVDTDQYLRNEHYFNDDDLLIVTQKLHGSSGRWGVVPARRELSWWERALVKLGVQIQDTRYEPVAGSRRVIKDVHNPAQQSFYGDGGDLWAHHLEKLEQSIPKGFILFGEIVGFTSTGKAIQKGHTYEAQPGESEVYIYRIAQVNEDGITTDLSWDQIRGFCNARGIKHVPELWRGFKKDFDPAEFEEKNFFGENWNYRGGYADKPVALSKGGTGKDEGIVIRLDRDSQTPYLSKIKNPSHYLWETAELDTGEEGIEA